MYSPFSFFSPDLWWIAGIPLLQILAAIHVVRTGRPYFWLWIILFFPGLGVLIYFLAEVLPYAGRFQFSNPIPAFLDWAIPGRELARLQDNLDHANTVANRQALAAYHLRRQEFPEAVRLYESCLSGVYKDDPVILLELARVQFLAGQHQEARASLETLAALAPQHERRLREFLLARVLEETGDKAQAFAIYAQLRGTGPMSEEARVRLARHWEEQGDRTKAKELYTEVVRRLSKANNHYRREQREWLLAARKGLKQLAT